MPLLLFTITGKFTYSAIAGALFDGVYGISCMLIGKLEHKKDITKNANRSAKIERMHKNCKSL